MKLDRIMLAAPKSGSGKTTITCALLQAFKNAGKQVVSYKCGPDYIDPMFHKKVLGIPSKNLDTFFTDDETTRQLFLKNRREEELVIVEGVMGLFDGLGGVREEGSSYHLARVTKTPIILVVDAKGMAISLIPLLAGFLSYDTAHLIRGVILNRITAGFYETIKPLIEQKLGLYVLGFYPDCKEHQIKSRHLGLMLPGELSELLGQLQQSATQVQRSVSLDRVLALAGEAEELEQVQIRKPQPLSSTHPIIAVARDDAFCFYYEENIELLEAYGADIRYFSPLLGSNLPDGCSGLLLGGGYPELYAEKLSENKAMLSAIKEAAALGMPIVAECGGFLYLHKAIKTSDQKEYPMVGLFDSACFYGGKLVRFGYASLRERRAYFLPENEEIRGHEFHYYDSEDNGKDCVAVKPVSKKSYSCIREKENLFAGFPHLYYPSNPSFAQAFVRKAADYQKRRL